MKKIYVLISLLSASLFFGAGSIMAQVTIGSGVEAAKGAVLDIKTQAADADNVTSMMGGVVMPRMQLQSINTLEPMISNADPDITELKRLHTGLMVYNLTDNASFKEGLYVWNGAQWEGVISAGSPPAAPVEVENGLTLTADGSFIELGGALNANTVITQNNNMMNFTATGGALSVNANDFIVQGGNTGIGKAPSSGNKLDIGGNLQINNGNMTVEGVSELRSVEIVGTSSAPSYLVYSPNDRRKANRYLVTTGATGLAKWVSIGGLSAGDMEPLPASTLRFNPADASTQTDYMNTGIKVDLPPGKWLINYSVRMISLGLNSASTASIRPTSFRFTLLDEGGVPIPYEGNGIAKPYDDSRAYPDTYFNSLSGFFVVMNDSYDDKEYSLGIKTQELGLNWPSGDVELINRNTGDAYIIPLFMRH